MSDMFSFLDDGSDSGGDIGSTIFDSGSVDLSSLDLSQLASGFEGDIGNLGITPDFLQQLSDSPELLRAFQAEFPEDFALIKDIVGGGSPADAASGVYDPNDQSAAETARLQRQANATSEADEKGIKSGVPVGGGDKSGVKSFLDKAKQTIKDVTGLDAGDAAKYAAMLAAAKLAYDDAERARKEAKGWTAPSTGGYTATRGPKGTSFRKAASGGVMSLGMAKGRYLGGMTDGMADKVPAHIDNKRPAALSDGEFVIPADVVSHLGNGNSNAGAKRLYEMMDDIRAARTGNPKQGKQINPDKFMPR
jgi:hypothetical protein